MGVYQLTPVSTACVWGSAELKVYTPAVEKLLLVTTWSYYYNSMASTIGEQTQILHNLSKCYAFFSRIINLLCSMYHKKNAERAFEMKGITFFPIWFFFFSLFIFFVVVKFMWEGSSKNGHILLFSWKCLQQLCGIIYHAFTPGGRPEQIVTWPSITSFSLRYSITNNNNNADDDVFTIANYYH